MFAVGNYPLVFYHSYIGIQYLCFIRNNKSIKRQDKIKFSSLVREIFHQYIRFSSFKFRQYPRRMANFGI